jgi:signal transduction histidine kinase
MRRFHHLESPASVTAQAETTPDRRTMKRTSVMTIHPSPGWNARPSLPGKRVARGIEQRCAAGPVNLAIESETILMNEPLRALTATGRSDAPAEQSSELSLSIRETLLEAIEALAPAMPRGVRIALGAGLDVRVRANAVDVFRILLSVLRLAVDLAVEGGQECDVRITGCTVSRRTSVSIRISGPALPPLVRERFDLPIKAPQHSSGCGLGLPTAHYLALINGGAVEIAASGVLGVLFEIVLPRAPLR